MMESREVGVALLNDTRRNSSNEQALNCKLESGRAEAPNFSKAEHTYFHEREWNKMKKIAGVTTAMAKPIAARVGTIIQGTPAVVSDPRGWGRYKVVTIIGSKTNGVQPALVYLNIYSATPKGAWAIAQEKELGDEQKSHQALIADITSTMAKMNTAGLAVIA